MNGTRFGRCTLGRGNPCRKSEYRIETLEVELWETPLNEWKSYARFRMKSRSNGL